MASKFWEKMASSAIAVKIADEGISGCKEVVCKFAGNYTKRRGVGFTVVESAYGGLLDTKNYYVDIFTGRDPVEMIPAIEYKL